MTLGYSAIAAALAALVLLGPPATAREDFDGGFKLRKVTTGIEYDDDRKRSKNGSTPRELYSVYPYVDAAARYENFFFGGKVGPRRMTGEVGEGPLGFKVDSYGYRASGYGSWMAVPGLFFGLGVAYQLDTGDLTNDFVRLDATLSGLELRPLVLAVVPYGDLEFEFFLGANLIDAKLEVETFADERFKTQDGDAGAQIDFPIGDGVRAVLGAEGRYTWREDVVLGGQKRDRFSVKLKAALGFEILDDYRLDFRLDARPFDSVDNDKGLEVRLVRRF